MLKSACLSLFLAGSPAAQTLEIDQGLVTRADSLKATLRLGTRPSLAMAFSRQNGRTATGEPSRSRTTRSTFAVADLVEAWDFCFCPRTMPAMRRWLIDQYGSLAAIDREWEHRSPRSKR